MENHVVLGQSEYPRAATLTISPVPDRSSPPLLELSKGGFGDVDDDRQYSTTYLRGRNRDAYLCTCNEK